VNFIRVKLHRIVDKERQRKLYREIQQLQEYGEENDENTSQDKKWMR